MAESKTRTDRAWRRFLLLWAAALLLLGFIGCAVLYRYLGVYEVTRPELYMDRLMAERSAGEFLRDAQLDEDLPVSPYEDPAALYEQVRAGLPLEGRLSYRSEKRLSSRDRAVFVVRSGAANLCTVTLVPDEPYLAFGRHGWTLGRIGSGDFTASLRSVALDIYGLEGQALFLNGRALAPEDQADNAPPEGEANADVTFVHYRIAPLYGDLRLTDAAGNAVPLTEDSASHLTADAASLCRRDLRITAPADLTVLVDGRELESTQAQQSAGILEGLSSVVSAPYRCLTYTLSGVYGTPEITARDPEGRTLTPVTAQDGTVRFYYENDPEAAAQLEPYADRFFQSFVTYTSSAYSQARYYDLLSRIRPGTALYDYINQSKDAMIWAPYTETEFHQLRYDNFHYLSPTCFLCTVRYDADMTFTARNEDYSYGLKSAYELAFVLGDKGWLAAAMAAVA